MMVFLFLSPNMSRECTNKVKDDSMVSQIFDIRGNLIYQAPEEQLKQISLQQGIYIQKDENGNTKKFIVK